MTVTVKFFSSLRETTGLSTETLNSADVTTVVDVWNRTTNGIEMPSNVLIAVNMDYVDTDQVVLDGDEVAFFPPVSGG